MQVAWEMSQRAAELEALPPHFTMDTEQPALTDLLQQRQAAEAVRPPQVLLLPTVPCTLSCHTSPSHSCLLARSPLLTLRADSLALATASL